MIMKVLFSLSLICFVSTAQAASDRLASRSFDFSASSPDTVVEKTVSDLRSVFRRYKPAFDSSTTVVRPLQVGGSQSHPTIEMEVRKCVLFVCRNVVLDATVSIREVNGSCRRNYVMRAELSRSSDMLTEHYQSLTVNVCYKASGQQAQAQVDGFADRAPTYSRGAVSGEILKMLNLQVDPMTKALQESLRANGARSLVVMDREK